MAATLKTIAGRFEIEAHARSGGMGDVYVARDRRTGEKVALKLLVTSTPNVIERFLREAQILSEIAHRSIVGHIAHGIGVDDHGEDQPYLVMRWVPGRSLHEYLAGGATLSIHETLDLALRLAEALALIHERGIVHRDLKPSNIILEHDRASDPVLLDFGIARLEDRDGGGDLTRTGDLLGTPGYMAPEQAQGTNVDARADIFALGCVVFRCLVGRSPFDARDPLSAAVKVLLEDAPKLRDHVDGLPYGVDALVSRMLSRDPNTRPSDGAALVREIVLLFEAPTIDDRTLARSPSGVPAAAGSARSLGGIERRVISLVIARRLDWEATTAGIEAIREILDERLEPLGMRATVLTDGSIIIASTSAQEDDSPHDAVLRAARAALIIMQELPDSKVVVATGRGVMDDDHMPVGEIVERAIEVLDRFGGEGVVVDQTSASLLVGRFAIDERHDEDVGTIRVLVGESRAGRTLLGKPSSLVGRTRELATLEMMLDECRTDSVARAMLVTAEPGVGKSRLCSELLSRARKRGGVRLWTAYGDPATRRSPLSMLASLISTAAELHHGDSPKERRRKIYSRAAHVGCSASVAMMLSDVVAPALDSEITNELRAARRDRLQFATLLRSAWETFVTATCAKTGPLVIVLEDLHWADARTVDLVDNALDVARDLPLFVLALARPEVARVFPNLFALHGLQELKLLGLTARASAELVRTTLGEAATESVMNAIVSRAQGNALFLEELIRGVAEGVDGPPESLVAMMDRRLSALDSHSRRVLRAASIFGELATAGGVHALVGGESEAAVAASLARLAELELLAAVTDEGFVFRHALLREAAYATLTEEDRCLGHQLAGEWLIKTGEHDADPLVLAEHFLIGGDRARACEYLLAAAEDALAKNDLEASLLHADRVSSLGPTSAILTRLRMMQAEANLWRDEPAALSQAAEILALVPEYSAAWYRGAAGFLFVAMQLADFSRIVDVIGRLDHPGPDDPDHETASMQVMAFSMATWILSMVGVNERASKFFDRARALESKGDDDALGWLGIGHFHLAKYVLGDAWRALHAVRRSREKFSLLGDLRLTVLAQILEVTCLHELGAYEEALPMLEETRETCERVDLSAARGDTKRWLGVFYIALGRPDEGLAMLEAAHKEIKNTLTYRGAAKTGMAHAFFELGRFEEARNAAAEATVELTFAPSHCTHALAILARAELRVGNLDAALEAAQKAAAIVDSIGVIGAGEAPIFAALGEVHEARGEVDEAKRAIKKGVAFVRARAAKVEDPHYRKSFENRVEANAWLLQRA